MGKKEAAIIVGVGLIVASGGLGAFAGVLASSVAVGSTVASLSLTVGLSLVGMAFSATPQDPDSADEAGQKLQTIKSNTAPVAIIYGENKVGGNIIWHTTNNHMGGTTNKDYWAIIALGDGPIEDVTDMYFNEDEATKSTNYFYNDYVFVHKYTFCNGMSLDDVQFVTEVTGSPQVDFGYEIFSTVSSAFTASTTEPDIPYEEPYYPMAFDPELAEDGDFDSFWLPTTNADEWIKIIEDAVLDGTVDNVKVQIGGDATIFDYNFVLQYSDDDATWYTASDTMQSENRLETAYWLSITGIVATSHKYWRIYFNKIEAIEEWRLQQNTSPPYEEAYTAYSHPLITLDYNAPIIDIEVTASQKNNITIPKNLSFLAVHQQYDSTDSAHIQLDNLTSIVKGKKLRGLSATEISENLTYSNNPARIVIDILMDGLSVEASDIDVASFYDVHEYCNAKNISCNIVFNKQISADVMLRDVLATMRGFIVYSEGKWKLIIDREAGSVKTLTTDDIINGSLSIGMKNNSEIANKITFKYINPADEWLSAKTTLEDTALVAIDGQSIEQIIEARGITNVQQTQLFAQTTLNEMRYSEDSDGNVLMQTPLSIAFVTTIKNAELEVGDVITISHDLLNYDRKFLIISLETDQSGAISVKGREYCNTHYTYGQVDEFLLLEDGTSYLLLEDGTSKLRL